MFINSETRHRNRFIEASIADARDQFVNNPHMQRWLGGHSIELAKMCDRLFIPNIRDNAVTIPRRHFEDGIPILARTCEDEDVWLGPEFFAFYPRQRRNIAAKLKAWGAKVPIGPLVGRFELLANKEAQLQHRPLPKMDVACVSTYYTDLRIKPQSFNNAGKNPLKQVGTRPIVVFDYSGSQTPASSPTFAHELTHVDQSEKDTLTHFLSDSEQRDFGLRWELEAAHVGACVARARVDNGFPAQWLRQDELVHFRVDDIRSSVHQNYLAADPYEPTEELKAKFEGCGMGWPYEEVDS